MSDAGKDRPSKQLVEQRIRNRVIEYLELAASFDAQREYAVAASFVNVPYQVIDQWDDNFPSGLQSGIQGTTVYTPDEVAALAAFSSVLDEVSPAVPDDYPTLAEVQAMPCWIDLRRAAASALGVLMRRGPMPEDDEVSS